MVSLVLSKCGTQNITVVLLVRNSEKLGGGEEEEEEKKKKKSKRSSIVYCVNNAKRISTSFCNSFQIYLQIHPQGKFNNRV